MKKEKYIISRAGYELEFVYDGAISQINGLWFGFCKQRKYKRRGTSKYTTWRATELSTGMLVNNQDDEFLTRAEAVEFCRKSTDKIYELLNSGADHVEKLKKMIKREYERCGQDEMIRRLYGEG